jgi:MYXO-CTERM domain-containing protein
MPQADRASSRRVSLSITLVGLLWAPAVLAHIDLLEPEARAHGTAARDDPDVDANSNLKSGPCGQITSGRTERVATYAPGQRVTVRVREENAHVSYLRVSLDLDGEDFPLRTQFPGGPETQDVVEAAEAALGADGLLAVVREDNDTLGFVHEIDVTLPDATCDSCTLQVLQYMYDDPSAPYYFQCADLVIAEANATDAADAGGVPGTGSGGAGGSATPAASEPSNTLAPVAAGSGNGGAPPMADGQGAAETAGTGGAPPAATNSAPGSESVVSDDDEDDGGCGVSRRAPGPASTVGFALLALALGFTRRRR